MSKSPSERKGMPGESEELNRDTRQGERKKEGQKEMDRPDWNKDDQQHHQQGEPLGQQPKQIDPDKRQPADSEEEETDERKRRPA